MTNIEKVLEGLKCCMVNDLNVCRICPYTVKNSSICDRDLLLKESFELLKTQQSRVMTLNEMNDKRGRSELIHTSDVNATPTVGGWISVKDRLPETRHGVLAFTPHSNYILALSLHEDGTWYYWMDMGRKYYNPHLSGPITHWMPLPEPPKGDNNAEQ